MDYAQARTRVTLLEENFMGFAPLQFHSMAYPRAHTHRNPCYNHLIPLVHHPLDPLQDDSGALQVALTGSPGIGKSVLGALLTKSFIHQQHSSWCVVHWERENVFLFSSKANVVKEFSLKEFGESGERKKWFYGYWRSSTEINDS